MGRTDIFQGVPMLEPAPPIESVEVSPRQDETAARKIDSMPLHLAYQACEAIARRHYENFPVASWFLPVDRRQALAALYAFARIADDVADSARPSAVRLERLDQIEEDLLRAIEGRPPNPIFTALADALDRHQLPAEPLFDLLHAFRSDARDATFATWDDLLDYCRGSANTIGRMVLALYRVDDARAFAESDAVCTALQLTNFWQDLGPDLARGRLFIPLEDMARIGVSREELSDPRRKADATRLIELLCRATDELFERGRGIPGRVPLRLAIQLRATMAGGRAILHAVERRGQDVIRHRPSLGPWSRIKIAAGACLGFAG
jgi:squalene synthase HpnC